MEISKVIETVRRLQDDLVDVDGLSTEYWLDVITNGDDWVVRFCGLDLIGSEEFLDDEDDLRDLIVKGLKDIRGYLILTLGSLKEEK